MIYNNFNELIPNLKLTVLEYYLECYDIKNYILENPLFVFKNDEITVLGFVSQTKNIKQSSFSNDTALSQKLYSTLKQTKFYFSIYYKNIDPEHIEAIEKIFSTKEELEAYIKQVFIKK